MGAAVRHHHLLRFLLLWTSPNKHHLLFIRISFLLLILLLNPRLSVSITQDEALIKFKESLTNTTVLDPTWIKGTNPCDNNKRWARVQCEADAVESLFLGEAGLSGDIDIEPLIVLEGLRVLELANNSFTGTIPEFFFLGALKSLFIDGNHFSGDIPKDFFSKMGSLKKLWFSRNKFSGPIPNSLFNLKHLIELHLNNNEFSGPIPAFSDTLMSIDLSNNKLQGEIPPSLSRFGVDPFKGNEQLCGQHIGKECAKAENGTAHAPVSYLKWVILGLVVTVLLMTILFKAKRKDDHFNQLGKENLDERVHAPTSTRKSMSIRNKGGDSLRSSSRRGGSSHGKSMSQGDLVLVNDEKGAFGLPDLMKAAAEVLGNGVLGSAYKAKMVNGMSVVVKRFREMNKMSRDTFDLEMRKLGKLRHRNILQLLAYHYRKEEKLLVSEHVPRGSLLYLLHGDRGIPHAELNWPTRLKIIQGVTTGMCFLHSEFPSYAVPHGNLKSSNILLSNNYDPLLSDYAFYPLINNTQTVQSLFAYRSPEAIQTQQVTPKSDVYCLGIIILEILTGKFPSQYLNNQKGGTDIVQWVQSAIAEKRESELIDPEIATATDAVEQMVKLLHIGAVCTISDQDKRIDMKEVLRRIEGISLI